MCGFGCVVARRVLAFKPSIQNSRDNCAEQLLLQQLRAGDARACEEFISRHQRALQRRARYLVSDAALSQDVVQETWLAVFRGISKFEGRSSLKTWVFQILRNRATSLSQREKHTIPASHRWTAEADRDSDNGDGPNLGAAREMVRPLPDPKRRDPEAIVMAQERISHVKRAILSLSPRRRRVVELRIFRGYSAQSVSRILGITEGNQRVLLHRARLGLRDAIAELSGR